MKKLIITSVILSCIAAVLPGASQAQTITTIAGCGTGDDSLATHAEVFAPTGMSFDVAGNTYIAQAGNYVIRKISSTGVVSTYAGNGNGGYSGDGGPATAAMIGQPYSCPIDRYGNMYIVDAGNSYIRKVTPAGIISTIAGTGTTGYSGDGGPASAAQINNPTDAIVDTFGNIIFADFYNYVVRKINTAGIISTIVGDGSTGTSGSGGPATAAELAVPYRVAMDKKGNLYIAEVGPSQYICKVDTAGIIWIIAGTGAYSVGPDGDGGPATAATMTSPCGLALDTMGNLYFSDINNARIRKINLNTGIISAYAGNDSAGYSGDGGAATLAQINTPEGLICDMAGNLYICDDESNRVRMVNKMGVISTFAGQSGLFGDGYGATNAEISIPANICTDAAGNIYVADIFNNRVCEINAITGVITTVAGCGIAGYDDAFSGDGGPATLAHIYNPVAVAVDNSGNIYIADAGNERIRMVNTLGIITTIAGTGTYGYNNDGVPGTISELAYPSGVAADNAGNVYIADLGNNRIRMVNSTGIISTIAGVGLSGYSGDGFAATNALLSYPNDVALDGMGNIYIADQGNYSVRKIDASGVITTIAGDGTGTSGFTGDGGPATSALLGGVSGIKAYSNGDVIIGDAVNERIRMVNTLGTINTIAGNGMTGFAGDGGPALNAVFNNLSGVGIDPAGNMYIADGSNYRIRKTTLTNLAVPVIGKTALGQVLVYPNPTTGIVNIINAANCSLVAYDITGRVVASRSVKSSNETLDLSSFASGVYLVQLANNDGEKVNVNVVKN